MSEHSPAPASLAEFSTWAPLLRLLRAEQDRESDAEAVRVAGRVGREDLSPALARMVPSAGGAEPAEGAREWCGAVERVRAALVAAGLDAVSFNARTEAGGECVLRLRAASPAVESGVGTDPGVLVLVDGAVPEPWRRLPEPVPGMVPAGSVDLESLERTLRARLPRAVGATAEEIAAAEARLGITLPEELRVLYRVTRARWEDLRDGDHASVVAEDSDVDCELFDLDGLYVADAASRPRPWRFAATEAVVTGPDAAVQGLVGSPGWIVFGDNGGGDRLAVDLTPGPGGHLGQIVMISHEDSIGAELVADSLTDFLLGRLAEEPDGARERPPSAVAHVNIASLRGVEVAAHPGLEVLCVGVWDDAPLRLAPLVGLPRLRTLTAYPGTLADPSEIAALTGLEFLELGPEEWRVLLDAGAVPRSLLAASVIVRGERPTPGEVRALANEILDLWHRPRILRTVLEADLGPLR
ncbi:SMI1/KNR4 family protein (plasmid) [Streptomyces sp. BI20]|uniref:SMI1/KNR4 family protein n=1 Tax=Streptomyces sp. BI20 TaxID=3403460 RepID=UPI003C754112